MDNGKNRKLGVVPAKPPKTPLNEGIKPSQPPTPPQPQPKPSVPPPEPPSKKR